MRILHNLDNSNRGGIPEFIFRLFRNSRHHHEFWAADGSMAAEMRAGGMNLWDGGPPADSKYDVVIGHTVGGWSGHDLAGWAHDRGIKFVEEMHSPCSSPTPPGDCDGFITQSDLALAQNRHMPKAARIYSPIEVYSFGESHGPAIGRLSRLVDEKRPQDFVEVARHFPNEQFLMAGDGNMFESLRQQSPGNVNMVGWIRDFPEFYSRLKMFLFSTRDECCSMSLAMAQAAGLPCIVQDTPAIRETTGGHAIFCGDVPSFVSAVNQFLSNPDGYADLATAGRDWARQSFNTIPAWDEYMEAV